MKSTSNRKDKAQELSQLYQSALRQQLSQGAGADLGPAREIGRHAVSIGLETLDLARIHELALVALEVPTNSTSTNNNLVGLAGLFFAEAITPIEQTHRGAREANTHLNQIVKTLSQRTLELANSVEELKQEILQRKAVEESLRASELTSGLLLEQSRQMQEELRHLSRQLLSAQEEERLRISRELHDVVGQTLTSINVRLASLKAVSTTNTRQLYRQIAGTQRLVEKSVDIVHRFARELRPALLDDLGLIPALHSFMKGAMHNAGIRASLKVYAGIEEASGAVRTVLYRVAQEALTNVVRHAKASHTEVRIESLKGIICMTITDDGQGFQVAGNGAKPHNRLGLLGMRERVEMLGGTLSVESAPGHATTIRVELPPANTGPEQAPSPLEEPPATPPTP
ncbi:MAG: sensor histidine kinase [Verrucomicrobia bacterium]|nr:sensor histidine kinase [Verrucomicrobiota bacterium]